LSEPANDLLLAVPNVSEGADAARVNRLAAAFSGPDRPGAALLASHSDELHGRSVFSIAGRPTNLGEALLAGAEATIAEIDLRSHAGAHPRIGALDVCPVVYLDFGQRLSACELAREVAERLAGLELPVFLYGELAASGERHERAYFRRGGLVELTRRMAEEDLRPDYGPDAPHPSAGAVLVTARPPLAAFNVEIAGAADIEAGRRIAAAIRESGGGLPGVRAIAIELPSGRIQISTNVHDPVAIPLGEVVEAIRAEALPQEARPVEAELVGLVAAEALRGYPPDVPIRDFDPLLHTIEARVADLAADLH
jgi:glutamate formiminotransferase